MFSLPNLSLFILTLVSGLAAYLIQKKSFVSVKLFLAFSGAFLLATCFIHLLPEVFENENINAAPFILLGFFIQILIDYISQGVEHGHIHKPTSKKPFPFFIYLGLCIHAFAEGMPLSGIESDFIHAAPLFWGVLLHKIPIVFILATLLLAYETSFSIILLSLTAFSLMTPFGGYIGSYLVETAGLDYLTYFLAASTGIFLHISTVIIFESSQEHRFNLLKFIFILAGGLLSILLF